jgi:thiamine biosynthesis lipoprotein
VGGVLNNLGYGQSAAGSVSETLASELTSSPSVVQLAGTAQLDFGGFGKGYLIDKLADLLTEHGVSEWIINGGGDIRLQSTTPIELALEHPLQEGMSVGTISLISGSLACSAPSKRSWKNDGQSHHHIISPKTGSSFTSAAGSFVTAPTALDADCAATCFLLADAESYKQLSQEFTAEYLLINNDGQFTRSTGFAGALFS